MSNNDIKSNLNTRDSYLSTRYNYLSTSYNCLSTSYNYLSTRYYYPDTDIHAYIRKMPEWVSSDGRTVMLKDRTAEFRSLKLCHILLS